MLNNGNIYNSINALKLNYNFLTLISTSFILKLQAGNRLGKNDKMAPHFIFPLRQHCSYLTRYQICLKTFEICKIN